jgi:riboflavin-specific deaminase-like protein
MVLIDHLLEQIGGDDLPKGRPRVLLSYAQSLDGSLALHRGERLALSSAASLQLTHQLRAAHQGILVGIGTVLVDDPSLTVRLADGSHPQPIVLDSQLRFPDGSKLLSGPCPPWIAVTSRADERQAARLENQGARLIVCPETGGGRVHLPWLMQRLRKKGVKSLMVEGGPAVISSFLVEKMADALVLTLAPVLAGGFSAVEHPLLPPSTLVDEHPLAGLPRLERTYSTQLGPDLIVWGRLAYD